MPCNIARRLHDAMIERLSVPGIQPASDLSGLRTGVVCGGIDPFLLMTLGGKSGPTNSSKVRQPQAKIEPGL